MPTADAVSFRVRGGAFLAEESTPERIFTIEDLSAEQWAVARTAAEFVKREVTPNLEPLMHQEPGVGASLLRKSAEVGLTAMTVPEAYGGMDLDLATSVIAEEQLATDGSYMAWHGAHSGIGTLPILFFGTEAQKTKYLPKLASGEMIAAYALTEPHAGSDALAARTRADLSPDGKSYILNGQKMWITNGGVADLFTVFAKVGGTAFSAFLVERGFGGVSSGAEEKKMGIKGSSTTAVYFENVAVPVENLLGEVGRGHIIAFNILNMGRLKLGALAASTAKHVLSLSLKYAKERKAFGSPIADFGAIQHKLAEMAIRTYAAESAAWRIVGMVQEWPDTTLKALEEYAIECSMMKVYGSEVLAYVTDEAVQIHGGYGYHQDYEVERAYRDARILRIFEGTNEINRLLTTGMLVKRMARGDLKLFDSKEDPGVDQNAEARLVANAKRVALLCLSAALEKFQSALDKQHEVMMNIADIIMEAFVMESTLLRTKKLMASGKAAIACDCASVFLRDAMSRIDLSARSALSACGDESKVALAREITNYQSINSVAVRRVIAQRLLAREKFFL